MVTFSTGSRDTASNFAVGHPIGKIADVSPSSSTHVARSLRTGYTRLFSIKMPLAITQTVVNRFIGSAAGTTVEYRWGNKSAAGNRTKY
jgi:hypothetical protein